MTQANQVNKSEDFKLVIVFRIDGKNIHTIVLRLVGIAATLVMIITKLISLFMVGAH